MTEKVFGPISSQWIAAYATASGDDNPLHFAHDPYRPVIVHGALIAALAERYVLQALPDARIRSMSFKFLSTVKAGECLAFRLGLGRALSVEGAPMIERRITVQVPGQRPCVIGNFVYEEART